MAVYAENASGVVTRLINNPAGLKYPTADGTSGQVVQTDASGNLSFDSVQAVITGAATTIDTEDLTASRALVSDGSGKVAVSDVTATELGYVDGVTSAIQTQLNAKVDEVSSTDNAIVRFNGTGGAVQNSGVTVDDSNNIITPSIIGTSSTGSLRIPVGTSAQRDGSPSTGMIRHNTQYGCPEYYNGTFWVQMSMGEPNIGDPFGGGFFAGYISETADGVATHMLIVSPKASGETTAAWDTVGGATTGFTSLIDGPTNSAGLAALGASYAAATFCEGLTINGYSDWYLPARNELEVAYYNLKNITQANWIASGNKGNNVNAVPPWEPVSTAYTAARPAQTTVDAFKVGGVEAFADGIFWSSSEDSSTTTWRQGFYSGYPGLQTYDPKTYVRYVRAFRRLAI